MDYTILEAYTDSNGKSNIKDSKSASEYVFTLVTTIVIWKSSKQIIMVTSTMESKFIAWNKYGEEVDCYGNSWRPFKNKKNMCHHYVYIVIVNLQLKEHRVTFIMVSL